MQISERAYFRIFAVLVLDLAGWGLCISHPPSISKYNVSIPEHRWNSNTSVSVSGVDGLHDHRVVQRISFSNADFYLGGLRLTVGEGGINAGGGFSNIWGGGETTAIGNTLRFYSMAGVTNALRIEGWIADNAQGKVGLLVQKRNAYERGVGIIRISGGYNSAFTGDVVVDGKDSHLYLGKYGGVIAVRSNITVRNGGVAGIERSNQIADTSTVTLQGSGSTFSLNNVGYALSEKFKTLKVEGQGRVLFNRKVADRYAKTLIVDDLIVGWGNDLSVEGWNAELDLFLVSKSSSHVRDSLSRIKFEGPNRQIVELRDYNKDYWKLYASPEPSTYGAILGAVGLGLAVWRRRRRGPC